MTHMLIYFIDLTPIILTSNEKNNKFTENDRFYRRWKVKICAAGMTSLQQEGSSQEGQVDSFEGLQVKAKS